MSVRWTGAGRIHQCQPACQRGGAEIGPYLTDRRRSRTKRHFVTDVPGTPLVLKLSVANRYDSMMLAAILDAAPSARSPVPSSAWPDQTVLSSALEPY